MSKDEKKLTGIGMTSQRTRNRLVARLREQGIKNEEANQNIQLTITDPVRKLKRIIDTSLAKGIHRIEWDMLFNAPMLTAAEIDLVEGLVSSIPGGERAALTALRRIGQAKNSFIQRQQIERLVDANPGIPIPERLLPLKARPGVYSIELKAGTVTQTKQLTLKKDPLNN